MVGLFGLELPLWLIIVLLLVLVLFVYTYRHYGIFREMGINGPTPLPFLGNLLPFLWQGPLKALPQMVQKHGKVFGIFSGVNPALVVADDDLLKAIQVKDFSHFIDRREMDSPMERPLTKMLTLLSGEEWRHVRNTCTPAFSGGKLRKMSTQMNRCARLLVSNMKATAGQPVDILHSMGAFSMDTIASVAFGMDIDSQKDPNDPFIRHAERSFSPRLTNPLLLLMLLAPKLAPFIRHVFGLTFIPKDTEEFFTEILERALEARKQENPRVDFLQLLLNAHEEENVKKALSHEEVLGQGFVFFFAGYTTVSASLTFTAYLLALHPEIQDKILDEINEVLAPGEDPDYDTLHKMTFLDAVISESLRLYSPALRITRICTEDVTIQGIHFRKGMLVVIPIQAIHMDPDTWPDPEKFDPDRFSAEQKSGRSMYAWQPFGAGPRHCIGMRLALMEIKTAFVHLVREFTFEVCDKTNIPIKRQKMTGHPRDVYLTLKQRA